MRPYAALFLLAGLFAVVLARPGTAQVPEHITYQGFLTNTKGAPLLQEAATLTFRLYDAPVDGTLLWQERHDDVPVTDGVFSVLLGQFEPLAVPFTRPLWLSLAVGNEANAELAPRTPLSAVPYALSVRGLRVVPHATSPDLIGGHASNTASANRPGAVIGGGGSSDQPNRVTAAFGTVSGGQGNRIEGSGSTIGGGGNNTAGSADTGTYATVAGGGGAFPDDGNRAMQHWSTVGGGRANRATALAATVSGGHFNTARGEAATVSGGNNNQATAAYSTVGGGQGNTAGGAGATVAGGLANVVTGSSGTVSGGTGNRASGIGAVVPGGAGNQARGAYSWAGGHHARAAHDGAFVWADHTGSAADSLVTTGPGEFRIRASGGVWMLTSLDGSTGVELPAGSGAWATLSDRTAKTALHAVDPAAVLTRVVDLPLYTWQYRAQPDSIRHLGPMAQDFYAAFGLGEDERHIATVDADGVALAAIQGLWQQVQALQEVVARQQAQIQTLQQALGE